MNECGIITIGQPDGLVTIGQPICGAVPRSPFDTLVEILQDVLRRVYERDIYIDEVQMLSMRNQFALGCVCGNEKFAFCTPKKADWYAYIALGGRAWQGGTWRLDGTTTEFSDFITSDELLSDNGYTLVFINAGESDAIAFEVENLTDERLPFVGLTGETSGYTLFDYVHSDGSAMAELGAFTTLMGGFEVDMEPDAYEYSRAFGSMTDVPCCYINEFSDVTCWLECPTQPYKIQMQMYDQREVVRCEGYSNKFFAILDGELKAERNALNLAWVFSVFGNYKGYYKGKIYRVTMWNFLITPEGDVWTNYREWLPCTNGNGVAGLICMQQNRQFVTCGGLECGD